MISGSDAVLTAGISFFFLFSIAKGFRVKIEYGRNVLDTYKIFKTSEVCNI